MATAALSLLCGCTGEPGGGPPRDGGPANGAGTAGSQAGGGAAAGGASAVAASPATPLVRRLTRDELAYTLEDVLGLAPTSAELAAVPQDRPLEGFVNIATSQTVSTEHVAAYAKLARAISSQLDAGFIQAQGACETTSSECQLSFVRGAGKSLFRRPLESQEATLFAGLFQSALSEGESFAGAARVVVEAMLQAPQFLYRLEHETGASAGLAAGQVRAVGGYEMATRLSYLLWSSAPDAALYQAAESGALDRVDGIQGEVARLLGSPHARRPTARFLTDWAKLESLPSTVLLDQLVSSVQAFYEDFLWSKQGPLLGLLTARTALLTPTLAASYGLTPTGEGIVAYDTSMLPGRMGLLTQPGLIAGMTNADGGAIVARGLFLQSQLLCGDTPSPPTAFADQIAQFAAAQPATASLRAIADVRAARPECGACHQSFDPLAYALEQFDYQGGFRQVDSFGNTLTTDGWIPGRFTQSGEDIPYAGVEDYMASLAALPAVGACLARQHLQFALGRKLGHEDDAVAEELFGVFAARGGRYPDMLAAIVEHPLFRELKVEP